MRRQVVEQRQLWRRTARRTLQGLWLSRFRIQVSEDLLNHRRAFNATNDPHRPAAGRAGPDVDTEDPLEALRPGHRGAGYPSVRY